METYNKKTTLSGVAGFIDYIWGHQSGGQQLQRRKRQRDHVNNSGYKVIFMPGSENYMPVEQIVAVNVSKAHQAPLTVGGIPDKVTFGDAPFKLSASGGSGTGVPTYEVVSGDAVSVDAAGRVMINHAGTAVITVTNPGDDNYLPVSHTVSLTIGKAAQKTALTYTLPESVAYGDASFGLSVSGGDGTGNMGYRATR